MKRWTWKFEEDGGCEGLSSTVAICRDGETVCILDRNCYPRPGTFPPSTPLSQDAIWKELHSFPDEMRRDAEFITDALNEKEEREAS